MDSDGIIRWNIVWYFHIWQQPGFPSINSLKIERFMNLLFYPKFFVTGSRVLLNTLLISRNTIYWYKMCIIKYDDIKTIEHATHSHFFLQENIAWFSRQRPFCPEGSLQHKCFRGQFVLWQPSFILNQMQRSSDPACVFKNVWSLVKADLASGLLSVDFFWFWFWFVLRFWTL